MNITFKQRRSESWKCCQIYMKVLEAILETHSETLVISALIWTLVSISVINIGVHAI